MKNERNRGVNIEYIPLETMLSHKPSRRMWGTCVHTRADPNKPTLSLFLYLFDTLTHTHTLLRDVFGIKQDNTSTQSTRYELHSWEISCASLVLSFQPEFRTQLDEKITRRLNETTEFTDLMNPRTGETTVSLYWKKMC